MISSLEIAYAETISSPAITQFTTDKTHYNYGDIIFISGHIENFQANDQ